MFHGHGKTTEIQPRRVLEKALPVFWTYGFARTTLPDLEQATGVNKSGLYAEFESKEALFSRMLGSLFRHAQRWRTADHGTARLE
ncbi:MAG: helix-turn-helix domain-containing protein [Aliidongia sp.]